MKKSFFHLPENVTERTRNAIIVISAYLLGGLLGSSYFIYQALRTPSWQLWVAALSLVMMVTAGIAGLAFVRRGHIDLGVWTLIITSYITAIGIMTAISGMGTIILAASIFLSSMVAVQTLQSRQSLMIIAGIVMGMAALVFDTWIETDRLSSPIFQGLSYFLVPTMLIMFGAVIFRQYRSYSLRNKLMVAFISLSVLATSVLSVFVYTATANTLMNNLERELTAVAEDRATRVGSLFDEQFIALTALSLNDVLQTAAEEQNRTYKGEASVIQSAIEARDAQWRAADAVNNNNDPLVLEYLNNVVAVEIQQYQKAFPDNIEIFATDAQGALLGTTNRTSDYYQADESWWQAAYDGGNGALFISDPEYDESAGNFGVQIALPLRDRTSGQVIGVLRATYILSGLSSILDKKVGNTGTVDIFVPGSVNYHIHAGQFSELELAEAEQLQSAFSQGMIEMEYEDDFSVVTQAKVQSSEGYAAVDNLGWILVFHQHRDEALASLDTQLRGIILTLLVVIAFAGAAAFGFSQALVGPIAQLTHTAEEVSAGNLNSRATVTTADEVGTLATVFNNMTSQLQNTLQGLERRVAERTQNLELAAEVGRSVSQVRALDFMLKDAAELIRSRFDLYYAQVYLTDPAQKALVLQSGTGTVGAELLGRGHRLPIDTGSINGRAAVEKRSVVISDTAKSTTFRPNPLLPDTRSEMAIPLIVGEKVVGVLDLQSRQGGALTEDILPAFEALAGQLAIAIQNAKLLADVEQARTDVESQARRLVEKNWKDYLDAIHTPEFTGFEFSENRVTRMEDAVDATQIAESETALSVPISVSGEPIGMLAVELETRDRTPQNTELINVVARQVAQQLESLRLLENAERYRAEAEAATSRATIEGWQRYMESRGDIGLGYLYDTKEVRPHNEVSQMEEPAISLPIKARDETVGKLSVVGLESDDEDGLELANVVAERLGAHVESLRLLEETKRGEMELDKRAQREQSLRQITSALRSSTNPETIMRTAVRELGNILGRRTVVQMTSPEQNAQAESAGGNGDGSAPVASPTESA